MACSPERVQKLLKVIDDVAELLVSLETGPLKQFRRHATITKLQNCTCKAIEAELLHQITIIETTIDNAVRICHHGAPYEAEATDKKESSDTSSAEF